MLKLKSKNKKRINGNYKNVLLYLMPVLLGSVTFSILFCLLCLYTYSTGVINIFTVIIGWISFAAGAFSAGLLAHKNLGGRGFATGAIYGILYCATALAMVLALSESESPGIFLGIPVSILFSMMGGITDSVNKH